MYYYATSSTNSRDFSTQGESKVAIGKIKKSREMKHLGSQHPDIKEKTIQ